jgi:hypothetical protein
MSPANPGESVREQLTQRSTEKALAGLNKESTEEQKSAFAKFLAEKKRKRRRPWK